MSIKTINVGAVQNDGTGDSLRDAFAKVNENFAELDSSVGSVSDANAAALRDRATHTGQQAIGTVAGLQAALDARILTTDKGSANGVASLDGGGKVPESQLPAIATAATLTGPLAPDKGGVPPGSLMLFAGTGLPAGYLKANGATVSRTTYAALFLAIGVAYGAGDGSTTFRLPDFRGEFPRGWDDGRGVDAARAFGSAQGDAFQAHTHFRNPSSLVEVGFTERATGHESAQWDGNRTYDYLGNVTGGAATGRTATETRPRNLAVNFFIKY